MLDFPARVGGLRFVHLKFQSREKKVIHNSESSKKANRINGLLVFSVLLRWTAFVLLGVF